MLPLQQWLPKHFFKSVQKMDSYQEIIAGTWLGKENTCLERAWDKSKSGAVCGFARFSTSHDTSGRIRGYTGSGRFTDDLSEENVWRRRRWCRNSGAAGSLLRYICENGFEHHVAANLYPWPQRCMRPPCVTSAGKCTPTRGNCSFAGSESEIPITAIVAGVDFGTLSVRVSIAGQTNGDCSRDGARGISAPPQARRPGICHAIARRSDARFGERYPRGGAKVAHLRRSSASTRGGHHRLLRYSCGEESRASR